MRKIAREYFMQRRGNCAQSVAAAWAQKNPEAAGRVNEFAGMGGGRSPEGTCGALYASCRLAGQPVAESIEARFREATDGHAACRQIRAARKLLCADCVELAAGLLEEECTRKELKPCESQSR
ncbi:hypothetical protein LLG95_02515 [bacterium]|nr:hypothetical protein [bacterium]